MLARADSWFAYPYWLDDRSAPDFARTVDIHRKPGYDPCELFFDPRLWWPKGRAIRRLLQKKLGFRTLFDVVPLDPDLVRGSHGVPAAETAGSAGLDRRRSRARRDRAARHDRRQRDLLLAALFSAERAVAVVRSGRSRRARTVLSASR